MKYPIWLAFLSIILLSACGRSRETQPIINSNPVSVVSWATYTATDVASHNSSRSCWSIIDDKVYDFTSWVEKHPGGPEAILKICGIDGTEILHKQHGTSKDTMLTPYYIGDLAK